MFDANPAIIQRLRDERAQGQVRDLNRGLQDLRKKARLGYDERVVVSVVCSPSLRRVIDEHREWLREQVLATELVDAPLADPLVTDEVDVGDERVTIALRRAA